MSVSVRNIVEKQTELRGLISRAGRNLKKLEIKKRTPEHVQTRIELLDANWKKFQDNHDMLTSLEKEDRADLSYFNENFYEVCEEEYVDSKSEMLSYRNELSMKAGQSSSSESKASCANHAPSPRQLLRIYLPCFSGLYREWRHFRDLFISMIIKNNEISDVEKLQYLKTNLSGEALQIIVNIDVIDGNFVRAWQVLVDRYENKRVLVDSHLSSLFSLQHVTQQSANQLKSLLGGITEALGALHSLGCPTDSWDCLIVYMVTKKLDPETLIDWEQQIGAVTKPVTFAELEKCLRSRIYALEAVAHATGTQKSRSASSGKPLSSAKSHQAVANLTSDGAANGETKTSTSSCTLCSGAHYLSACPAYHRKTTEQRQDVLKQKNLCFNCLGPHQFRNCRSSKRCQICGNPHHTLIHRSNNSSENQGPPVQNLQKPNSTAFVTAGDQTSASVPPRRENTQAGTSASTNIALSVSVRYKPVLLATALVKVTSCYGKSYEARALLDQGSEVSFITESLASLQLPRQRVSLPINGIGAQRSTVSRGLINLTIGSRIVPVFSLSVHAYVLSKLTSYMPPSRVVKNPWPHLEDLELADPEFSSSAKIDLILGTEVYSAILEEGLRKGGPDSPIAQKTTLGWILSGSVSSEPHSDVGEHPAHGLQCSIDLKLHGLVQRFWEQEEVTPAPRTGLSEEEDQCEQFFKETHSRDSNGRYIVRIPLKHKPEDLGNSYTPALRALIGQENRFALDSSIKSSYSKFMNEYEALNHMALVPTETSLPRNAFYLPHHSVIRESSSTTKVRVVFNGSSRTNYGISVNDLQHVGPKLQTDLADVIPRWRRYFYVFTADIEKIIVWRADPENTPLSYQLRTVTYGLASAPYLAIRTLQQLANDEGNRFPLATEIIQREIYVDDVLSGADTIPKAQEKIRQIDECLNSGCFNLKKWTASDKELLTRISPENREHTLPVSLETEQFFMALGILWHPQSDSFTFTSCSTIAQSRPTKRLVLSRVSQLFDPLGWIAPVVVRGKIFIQELWSAKLGWDEPLPDELVSQWNKFEKDLQDISSISVPRWLGYSASSSVVELHGFSDASQSALGAVIYLRVITDLNDARVTLVTAKTRVAPLKKVTVPRLELSAALLLVRQISITRKTLDLDKIPIHLWTDSTVALAYIRGDARRWGDYVRNRVTEIQELSNCQWHHISGKDNPADCVSRGLSPTELKEHTLWWNGPAWLSKHSTLWPRSTPSLDPDTALEIRKVPVTIANQHRLPAVWDLVDRFSSLRTLIRITAWCFRAIEKFRRNKGAADQSSALTPEELDHARLFWVKITQSAFFKVEIDQLRQGKPISRSSFLLRLAPFLDGSDLLRVGGRLQNSLLDHDEKHPLILPRESALTALIVARFMEEHNLHS
ncbi:uncharacterized protein LOC143358834 [Halictus rubicundus]|uniref:uncharacterized protein LOC143358834 n=1 Tax=Halictus rubicundus TaxID=77578 RepID=UPI004035D5E9